MRLLEPINGIKVAQGHLLIHLVFFITMFTFDKGGKAPNELESEIFELKKWGHLTCFLL